MYTMETITLQYNQDVKEKLMKFLETFSKKELKIIEENDERFEKTKAEVHRDYEASLKPDAVFYSVEEAEKMLEESVNSLHTK